MPQIKPTRATLLGIFVLGMIVVAVVRSLQNVSLDLVAIILLGAVLTPIIYSVLRIPSILGKITAVVGLVYLFFVLIVMSQFLETYGLLTGFGFIMFIIGPVATLPALLAIPILVSVEARNVIIRGLLMGAGGAVGAAVLVTILRSLQHLEPAWEINTVLLFAILAGLGGFVTGLGIFDPRKIFAGEPGLPRATMMAIIGFLSGGLLVIILRGLQSLDPLWHPGVGFTAIAFITAGFFVWGMGALDPKMSVHGEAHDEAHHEEEAEEPAIQVLGTFIWQISVLALVLLLVIAAVAILPGGPGLHVTADPLASTFGVGYFTLQLPGGGPEVQVSELVVFLGFFLFTLLSLALFGGMIALLFYFLSVNITEVRETKPTEAELVPPPALQSLGKAAGGISGWLRSGLPKLLGQR